MTNKELDEMNIKIAKKLGWKKLRLEHTPKPLNTKRMVGVAPGNERRQYVPHYTSNLAYALKLVEWANDNMYNFKLTKNVYGKTYVVLFNGSGTAYIGEGILPSMAICSAFIQI